MALVVITRERTVRLRKAYLAQVPQEVLDQVDKDAWWSTDEARDAALEPYYASAITTSADEVIEMTTQDRDLAIEVERVHPVDNKEDI